MRTLDEPIATYDRELEATARKSEAARRLEGGAYRRLETDVR